MSKVLFVVKKGSGYGYAVGSSGLLNSSQFVVDMLNSSGIAAKLVQVVDNNDIDREVFRYRPTHVVIEALWVVPEKFEVLAKLHPGVKWIVRVHSDVPFLAEEGIAIEWLRDYLDNPAVSIAFNADRPWADFVSLSSDPWRVLLLPNYYPVPNISVKPASRGTLRVGCFGAIRSMKNQLLQAVAAIRYANEAGVRMEFHINSTRREGNNGDSVLRNLRSLFLGSRHALIEHGWMNHHDFLHVMRKMDVALAVSMTETFCIVAADAIASGIPLICSDQIPWAGQWSVVEETDVEAIMSRMGMLTGFFRRFLYAMDKRGLQDYVANSKKLWLEYLR